MPRCPAQVEEISGHSGQDDRIFGDLQGWLDGRVGSITDIRTSPMFSLAAIRIKFRYSFHFGPPWLMTLTMTKKPFNWVKTHGQNRP